MLINATQKEEIRVALVDGQTLYDLDIEHTGRVQKKASIYKGRVTRVEPSLEAAFVDYGAERHGFLPLKEVAREYFSNQYEGRPHIRDALRPGQELIVQVDKEERGNKGAALTTFIGLAGCYLVLMPNNPRAGGISRRIEGEERDDLKDALSQLPLPEGMGLIVRTAGLGRNLEELRWDLDVLLSQWQAIVQASSRPAPFLIHRESDVIIRAIRDYLRPDISEILVDNQEAYQHAKKHIEVVRPDFADRVKRYQDAIPLFNRFQIESQIESAFKREVALENGASIVIDPTEALIAIDINSARATEGSDIEETALQTNLVAAKEIARQLRLRDIGGLIVIDFIDMNSSRNQRMVENQLREELASDRARIQLGRISRFGLLEMSRQRLRPSLGDTSGVSCPRCEGQGTIRNIQSLALALMRVIEDEAMKENTRQVNVQVPVDLAAYLLNEKRQAVMTLEERHHLRILVLPNPHLVTPQYEVVRIREDDSEQGELPSYKQITQVETKTEDFARTKQIEKTDEPAIKHITSMTPAPVQIQRDKGLIRRIWTAVFGSTESTTRRPKSTTTSTASERPTGRHHQHSRRRHHQRGEHGRDRDRERNARQDRHHERGERGERGERQERHERHHDRAERGERQERHERHHERSERAERHESREHHHERSEQRHDRSEHRHERGEQRDRGRRGNRNRRQGGQRRDDRYQRETVEAPQIVETPIVATAPTHTPVEAPKPAIQEVAAPAPVVKKPVPLPELSTPEAIASRKKQDATSFVKLSPEEKERTMVTIQESSVSPESHHYTLITTKKTEVNSPAKTHSAPRITTTVSPDTMVSWDDSSAAQPQSHQTLNQVVTKQGTVARKEEKPTPAPSYETIVEDEHH
ncbi:MAG: Rne/Rng family ribonuclease [Proteobacteria bacterium]|nr:Rne/Rng family ribonuclease [Pseudomonadota bacterium]